MTKDTSTSTATASTKSGKPKRKQVRVMIDSRTDDFYNSPYDVLKSVSLTMFDPTNNSNKFYVAEIHKSSTAPKPYRLYVNHGRVGTNGQAKSEPFLTLEGAEKKYNTKLREKLRKGYQENDVALQAVGSQNAQTMLNTKALGITKTAPTTASKTLSTKVQSLVEHIYSEANQALSVSISGSTKGNVQSPIGNLGINGINRGREILAQISQVLKKSGKSPFTTDVLESLSVDYYKTIPRKMPSNLRKDTSWVLNTPSRLTKEIDTLDLYEDALRLLPQLGSSDMDARYNALSCDIRYIDPTEKTMEYLQNKIATTHAQNHNFKLRVKNAYEVNLKNAPQFDPSCGNVVNLFHGSRSANLMGILSSHLKLPKNLSQDVHKTGAMFGGGIYFASDSTKSANYSFASFNGRKNKYDTAFLMVVEVAMGNVHKVTAPHNFSQPPTGYNSVMGAKGPHLINNEFIVYDPRQVRVRYLVEVEKV